MSRENVEIVGTAIEVFDRRDRGALVDLSESDLEIVCRLVRRGKVSGVLVQRGVGIVFRIRDGKLWRIRSYLDPSEALEAVGLSG